jgi:hypothetical protein
MSEKEKTKVFTYRRQFGVIAICADEKEQQQTFEMLQKLGLTLKVVCL